MPATKRALPGGKVAIDIYCECCGDGGPGVPITQEATGFYCGKPGCQKKMKEDVRAMRAQMRAMGNLFEAGLGDALIKEDDRVRRRFRRMKGV